MDKFTKQYLPMQILVEKLFRSDDPLKSKLNCQDRMVLSILSSYMGDKDHCWPSYRSILADTGIASHATLSKSLKKLESLNLVQITRDLKSNNKYKFSTDFIEELLQICSRVLQICNQPATDMSSNNININNNINNLQDVSQNEQKSQIPRINLFDRFWAVWEVQAELERIGNLICEEDPSKDFAQEMKNLCQYYRIK